jgi:glycosyltransferase involved in cell wall biosynthesis
MKFSIVTTCFNAAATIEKTILSVIANSKDFPVEHIITDAGSTDGTLEIIEKYSSSLRILEAKALNQSEGINLGLKASTGDILAFLNADDTYQANTFKIVAEQFNQFTEQRWLAGSCKIINEQDQEMQPWITAYKNFLLANFSYPLLLTENMVCQPATFFKPSLFKEYGYFAEDQNLVMDYEFWLRIAIKDKPIVCKQHLANFRRFTGTKSNTNFVRQFQDDKEVARKYAIKNGFEWTIPIKYINYMRTIGIYKLLY